MQLRYFVNDTELFNIAITASSAPRIGEEIILVDEHGMAIADGHYMVESIRRIYPVLSIPPSRESSGLPQYELTSIGSHEIRIGLYTPGQRSDF